MRLGAPRPDEAEHAKQSIANGATLLVLGGTAFQVPAILHALKLGCRVITCDYLPCNPGHRYAHAYVSTSTTDREAILAVARERRVDGILAYASDPAALTAAAVCEELRLPSTSVAAVDTLANKSLFRAFLRDQDFRVPRFEVVTTADEACAAASAIGFPVMIKPVDSSGSKGVARVTCEEEVIEAAQSALAYSRCKQIIVEEWIERNGAQVAGDGLVVDGRLVFEGFGDEHFDPWCSPHAPVGESLPGTLSRDHRELLLRELQRLFTLLGVRQLVFNLDAMIDRDGRVMLIEVGPRAGGNALPQLIQLATGVDLTDIAIRQALGITVPLELYASSPKRCFASHMLHSRSAGQFGGFRMAPALQQHALEVTLTAKPGETVHPFRSSRDTLGFALFGFPDTDVMRSHLSSMSDAFVPVVT
jgi:biotin carboxylase